MDRPGISNDYLQASLIHAILWMFPMASVDRAGPLRDNRFSTLSSIFSLNGRQRPGSGARYVNGRIPVGSRHQPSCVLTAAMSPPHPPMEVRRLITVSSDAISWGKLLPAWRVGRFTR
jgi:hypothetical protein